VQPEPWRRATSAIAPTGSSGSWPVVAVVATTAQGLRPAAKSPRSPRRVRPASSARRVVRHDSDVRGRNPRAEPPCPPSCGRGGDVDHERFSRLQAAGRASSRGLSPERRGGDERAGGCGVLDDAAPTHRRGRSSGDQSVVTSSISVRAGLDCHERPEHAEAVAEVVARARTRARRSRGSSEEARVRKWERPGTINAVEVAQDRLEALGSAGGDDGSCARTSPARRAT